MKRYFSFFLIILMISVFSSCKENPKIEADEKLHSYIISYAEEHGKIVLDDAVENWDYVVIDSAYHIQSSLSELKIANCNAIDVQYDDVIFVVFVLDSEAIAYTMFDNSNKEVFSTFQSYLYQNEGEVYYPKMSFNK